MEQDFTLHLNPMQKKAVLHTEGPLLLIAGAGSGKTRVLTSRVAYIVKNLAKAHEILAITFTNRAAKEMKERVLELLPDQGHDIWVSTFHSCCVRILRRDISHIGYGNSFTIYDYSDSLQLMKGVIKKLNINENDYQPSAMLKAISDEKNKLVTPALYEAYAKGEYRQEIIAKIYKEYQSQLYGNNALDFDDIIVKTIELFNSHPHVLEKYSSRFKYIMVDEYQDTNAAQYQLVRLLSSVNNNICVVGDDDQGIYGWRGANIENILNFEKDFYGAQTIKLEQNYRCSKRILEAANAVIQNNIGRKGKVLWTDAPEGEKIGYFNAPSGDDEARHIAQKIKEGVAAGGRYNDFAILYRMNSLSRYIEDELGRAGIKYRIYKGTAFYDRREIKDVMAYLRAIYNPYDDVSIKRIINVPKRGIGAVAIESFEQAAENAQMKFYDVLKNPENNSGGSRNKKIADFVDMLEDFRTRATEIKVADLISLVLDKSGYGNALSIEDNQDKTDRMENVMELINRAAEIDENKEHEVSALATFLEEMALVADVDDVAQGEDYVALMTLHSAKGLEFSTVFMPAFEEGIFPGYRALTDKAIEEERRLCYVGITRAQKKLHITTAEKRFQFGKAITPKASRFFDEIPMELIDEHLPKRPVYYESAARKPKPRPSWVPASTSTAATTPNFGKKFDLQKIKGDKKA